jgi:hypothetical protein
MNRRKASQQSVAHTRQGSFHLPPGVSFQKEPVSSGWAYVFRHATLGLLGRIVVEDRPGGMSQVSCEIAGDPADPMTVKRKALFEPVALDLMRRVEAQTGSVGGKSAPPPRRAPEPPERIASKRIQCETCTADVALLIFAERATDHGGLEDYARKMFPQVQQLNVPTYVVGPPVGAGPVEALPSDILKMWPERAPVRRFHPEEFHRMLAALPCPRCR